MPRSERYRAAALRFSQRPGPRSVAGPGGSVATRLTCRPCSPSPWSRALPPPPSHHRIPSPRVESSCPGGRAGPPDRPRAARRKKFSGCGRVKSVNDRHGGTSENAHIGWWRKVPKGEMSAPQTRTGTSGGAGEIPSPGAKQRSDQQFYRKRQGLAACPESECALLAYHLGAHMTRDAEEFSGRKEEPKLDSLVAVMTGMLFSPGLPAHSVERLNAVDGLFDRLDVRLRAGEEPPLSWRVLGADDNEGRTFVTGRYDVLSEVLRTSGGATECRRALRKARMEWGQLHETMKEGSAMPEPWWRSTRRL